MMVRLPTSCWPRARLCQSGWDAVLCYAALCYAVSCYAVLCYAVLCMVVVFVLGESFAPAPKTRRNPFVPKVSGLER